MGVREPLTRLIELMEQFGPTGSLPLNDERVMQCYRELSAIVDAHARAGHVEPVTEAEAQQYGREAAAADARMVDGLIEHMDPETGTTWMVKPSDSVGNPGRCRSCRALVMWVYRVPKNGTEKKAHPVNANGTSHFSTCPNAEQWRNR